MPISEVDREAAADRREVRLRQTRRGLLAAALELFDRDGYETTTIDQIAAQANVARQTVLNHYPHKRDLLVAWGQSRHDQLLALAVPPAPGEPATAALRWYVAALAHLTVTEPELTRVLYRSLRHDEVVAFQRPIPMAIRVLVTRGQASGEFDSEIDPGLAAEVVAAVYVDTLSRWLAEPTPFDLLGGLSVKLDLLLGGVAVR
jgi:AcrR family transcriptional regulator